LGDRHRLFGVDDVSQRRSDHLADLVFRLWLVGPEGRLRVLIFTENNSPTRPLQRHSAAPRPSRGPSASLEFQDSIVGGEQGEGSKLVQTLGLGAEPREPGVDKSLCVSRWVFPFAYHSATGCRTIGTTATRTGALLQLAEIHSLIDFVFEPGNRLLPDAGSRSAFISPAVRDPHYLVPAEPRMTSRRTCLLWGSSALGNMRSPAADEKPSTRRGGLQDIDKYRVFLIVKHLKNLPCRACRSRRGWFSRQRRGPGFFAFAVRFSTSRQILSLG
jgi:hypothetical protein